ncbi:F0F1 ATP synthase subunit B [Agrilactobacillus composti DSM 18527 = JCM 14202]|jgi:F-type H+-transporting ATPase subunit b|uniref:ATP synthase subunit b n=1 Tax=Agrilactobacillus composti DSM 18527 = JCM 14202 TaxID=1423734 RepID=X0PFL0_9LACO|nr:F0F1 ATP synthase subunit B [Agrilactobacillus composti]KRM36707.1 F0F1 ATP synthase subunit B [Agrilactobacillus composti DSM 18527 = JCM 14202]MCH4170962.1 F0F1 ATP synthase subunit B [Lactobacillus sp.]GAF40533.1 ATP synthase B chain [Agrilactobacillus composti DSM 18527 = JCM 14202]
MDKLVLGAALQVGDMLIYLILFVLMFVIVMKYAYGPVSKMMAKREDKINGDLDYAEDTRKKADELAAQREGELKNTRSEATQIVQNAQKSGETQRDQIITQAQSEAQQLKTNAQKDAEQARADALASARDDVAQLSIEIASKLINKELSASDQQALIDSYIEGLGDTNGTR